jgi:hypothetical protein
LALLVFVYQVGLWWIRTATGWFRSEPCPSPPKKTQDSRVHGCNGYDIYGIMVWIGWLFYEASGFGMTVFLGAFVDLIDWGDGGDGRLARRLKNSLTE